MPTVQQVCEFLEELAPPALAADWDNVGLLVGDPQRPARRIMTCLTVTPTSAAEAAREGADLVLTHHPLPFRPLRQLTTRDVPGRLLLQLAEARVAVYSAHTAYDSARAGINQQLAEGLGLRDIQPLIVTPDMPGLGIGRRGRVPAPVTLEALAERLKSFLRIAGLHRVGLPDQSIASVAIACGSAGELLGAARDAGCDLLVLGETNFHTCLEAEATGVALLLPGHYASERLGMDRLAEALAERFQDAVVWSSREEADPLQWI